MGWDFVWMGRIEISGYYRVWSLKFLVVGHQQKGEHGRVGEDSYVLYGAYFDFGLRWGVRFKNLLVKNTNKGERARANTNKGGE